MIHFSSPEFVDSFAEICLLLRYEDLVKLYFCGDARCRSLLQSRTTRLESAKAGLNMVYWPRLLMDCPLTELLIKDTISHTKDFKTLMITPDALDVASLPPSLTTLQLHFAAALRAFTDFNLHTKIGERLPNLTYLDFGAPQYLRKWRDEVEMLRSLPSGLRTLIWPRDESLPISVVNDLPRSLTHLELCGIYFLPNVEEAKEAGEVRKEVWKSEGDEAHQQCHFRLIY